MTAKTPSIRPALTTNRAMLSGDQSPSTSGRWAGSLMGQNETFTHGGGPRSPRGLHPWRPVTQRISDPEGGGVLSFLLMHGWGGVEAGRLGDRLPSDLSHFSGKSGQGPSLRVRGYP